MANTSSTGTSSASGTGSVQSLMIDVRASTQGFAQDITSIRSSLDSTLLPGFTQAGNALDTGLSTALKNGSTGFSTLRDTATQVLGDIANLAATSLLGGATGGSGSSGLSGLMSSVLGLPGRATGGPVSPGQPYLVGERGPELFVPTSAGAVASNGALNSGSRDVRVAINVNSPSGGDSAQSLQRSSRQVASAVRRALSQS